MIHDDFSLYKKGNAFLWTDEHISARMLAAHLDPDSDAASRKPEIIRRTVDWVDSTIPRGARILDLGCGPGLYAELFADRGHQVTGLDVSRRSIECARGRATERNLSIRYECLNYLSDPLPGEYDLVLLIYCDFGSLCPDEQSVLLAKVRAALAPKGRFVMDAFGPSFPNGKANGRRWHASVGGDFWSPDPHLYLYETKIFAQQRVVGE